MPTISINLNLNKRLPTGRPLTLDEGDENWDKLELSFVNIVNQINLALADAFTELMPNNSGIIMTDGVILGSGRLSGTTNWFICDGGTYNGIATPDLKNRMVVGAGDEYNTGFTGGLDQAPDHAHTDPESGLHATTLAETAVHEHGLSAAQLYTGPTSGESGGDSFPTTLVVASTDSAGGGEAHNHPSGGNTGDAGAHDNKPRCYALTFVKYCPGV